MNYTDEEKKAFIAEVSKWRSELVKFDDFNVYYHPNKPFLPYRKTYLNGYVKMVRWSIIENTFIRCMKDNEYYDIPLSSIESHMNNALYPAPKISNDNINKNTFSVSIPISLRDSFNRWFQENVESPF